MYSFLIHEPKVTVWCGITNTFIFCPYFFEEVTIESFRTCTATNGCWEIMMNNYIIPKLQERIAVSDITWMQDCAPPHLGFIVKRFLTQLFGNRIIYHHFIFVWPPRFSDLSSCRDTRNLEYTHSILKLYFIWKMPTYNRSHLP